MRRLALIALLALPGQVLRAQTPPDKSAIKVTGYRVSAEGGEEGTITYRYDDKGRPIDGAPRPAGEPRRQPAEPVPGAPGEPEAVSAPTAPGRVTGMRTPDGRPLPFSISGQNGPKTVDESVDADSALRRLTRTNDLLERRYDAGQVDLGLDERFATTGNVLTLDRWKGKSSALGDRRSGIELADTLGAEVHPKNLVEIKAVERPTSPWARRIAQPAGWDDRLAGSSDLGDRRVNRDELSTMGTRANAFPRKPGSIDQLSMQDINRYQFRRSRSTEPGLPVAKPGSERIEKQ